MLTLHDVYNEDGETPETYLRFLYYLLGQRDERYRLSHEEMPTYDQHVAFIKRRPYKAWYIIDDGDARLVVGSIYLTELNEIGVYVTHRDKRHGVGTWAVNELMRIHGKLRYFANIHPDNLGARAFFERQGFGDKPFQITLQKDLRHA